MTIENRLFLPFSRSRIQRSEMGTGLSKVVRKVVPVQNPSLSATARHAISEREMRPVLWRSGGSVGITPLGVCSACSCQRVFTWGSPPCSILWIQNRWAAFGINESQLKSKVGGACICVAPSLPPRRSRGFPHTMLHLGGVHSRSGFLSHLSPEPRRLNSLARSRPVGRGCGEFHHRSAPADCSFPCDGPLAAGGKGELVIPNPAPANYDSVNAARTSVASEMWCFCSSSYCTLLVHCFSLRERKLQ